MRMKEVQYSRVFSLPDYQNEKIGTVIEIDENDDPMEAFKEAKKFVELSSMTVTSKIEKAKFITQNPEDFTGKQVREAKEFLKQFDSQILLFEKVNQNVK